MLIDQSAMNSSAVGLDVSAYQQLNSSFDVTYVHQFGTGAGFCAEMVRLIKLMMICLHRHVKLATGEVTNPTGVAVAHGWSDYFAPLFPEQQGKFLQTLNRSHFPLDRFPALRLGASILLRGIYGPNHYMFNPPSGLPEELEIHEIGLHLDYWNAIANLARLTWRFNQETSRRIDELTRSIILDTPYVAVHIRRGDKIQEADYSPISAYLQKILELPQNEQLFVASDDYTAVSKLKALLPDGIKVSTLVPRQSLGYSQTEFSRCTASERWERTAFFLAELDVMVRATFFVGCSPSNVFYFLRQLRGNVNTIDVA